MRPPPCTVAAATLIAYGDGYLDHDRQEALDRHIPTCPTCQAHLRDFAAVDTILRAAPVLPVPNVWPSLRRQLGGAQPRRLRWQPVRNVAAAMLLIALLVTVLPSLIVWPGSRPGPPLADQASHSQPRAGILLPAPAMTTWPAPAAADSAAVTIDLFDIGWRVTGTINTPAIAVTVTPGSVIELRNQGQAPHTFNIVKLGIAATVAGNATAQITIPPDAAPGIYAVFCGMPGHQAAGMAGTLVVR